MKIQEVLDELDLRGYTTQTKTGQEVQSVVQDMLHTLVSRDGISPEMRIEIIEQLHHILTSGQSMSRMFNQGAEWVQFHLGDGPVGSILRIKPDAFSSELGMQYNGLACVLVAGRAGRALVRFVGSHIERTMYVHPMNLELLVERNDT